MHGCWDACRVAAVFGIVFVTTVVGNVAALARFSGMSPHCYGCRECRRGATFVGNVAVVVTVVGKVAVVATVVGNVAMYVATVLENVAV